ncbi:transaldolase [Acinetobacter ursingii]|uniref:Transaldolase n=1 Tax=Acinetobacter ursingii TaxID=108980 RepID=A0A7T9UH24_9GAMM|nr:MULTISPECIES: transaldolase [Acinetobacter]MEC8056416.1 transaldolase [Pseudomonadota bacterium]EXD37974.1 transaldolase [Acinetobacter sp. 479375]MCH2014630.1 transaldolase [Acinetobacter ursingii]MCU4357617.1 transaldolase [Acinetobacter ursingii]MCU4488653.1 transaldolase [Acinetobacter ursingii]
MTQTALDQLKQVTTVVADSSDLEAIRQFRPLDATTNPSLITAAASQPENRELIEAAYTQAREEGYQADQLIERTIDILTVKFGVEILKLIEGRVSTEVDASLSYDTEATLQKARELSKLYQDYGIDPSRVLIKIASTWEGIQAAKVLEAEGIACNLTLLFGLHQAQACADAHITLISPFVGRILDWYKKAENIDHYPTEKDPGVISVKKIYHYYKQHDIQTQVMGASFRSVDQVLGLAGCDLLTISPALLTELNQDHRQVETVLSSKSASDAEKINRDTQTRESFKIELEHDLMAFQLLQSGIDGFIKARDQLNTLLRQSFGIDAEIQP